MNILFAFLESVSSVEVLIRLVCICFTYAYAKFLKVKGMDFSV